MRQIAGPLRPRAAAPKAASTAAPLLETRPFFASGSTPGPSPAPHAGAAHDLASVPIWPAHRTHAAPAAAPLQRMRSHAAAGAGTGVIQRISYATYAPLLANGVHAIDAIRNNLGTPEYEDLLRQMQRQDPAMHARVTARDQFTAQHGTTVQEHLAQVTPQELTTISGAWRQLPAAHSRNVNTLIRIPNNHPAAAGQHANTGGITNASAGTMAILDRASTGNFGLAGTRSALSGHTGANSVSNLEHTIVHETGHMAHHQTSATFKRNFAAASGFEDSDQASLLNAFGLNASTAPPLPAALAINSGKYQYHKDGNNFTRRRLGFIPGDVLPSANLPNRNAPRENVSTAGTGAANDPAQANLHAYGATSVGEHFAELYAQMALTPELAHRHYVQDPATRLQEAQTALANKRNSWTYKLNPFGSTATEEAQVAERQLQQQRMNRQWSMVRRQVFGLKPEHEDQAYNELRGAIRRSRGLGRRGQLDSLDQEQLDYFHEDMQKAATRPHLDRLLQSYRTRMGV